MATIKLTKSAVEKLQLPKSGQAFVYDIKLPGFGVRLSRKTISFFAERRVSGKTRRVTLGRYPELTVDEARNEAIKALGDMAKGNDPSESRKKQAAEAVTLEKAYTAYIKNKKDLKPRTLHQYKDVMERLFTDWTQKPWHAITGEMVIQRHNEISVEHGPAQENLAMRVLRAVLNVTIATHRKPDGSQMVFENPVRQLSHVGSWNKTVRRTNYLKEHQLSPWYKATLNLHSRTARDFLLLTLFTGMRRNEAASLKRGDIDIDGRTLIVRDTKNGIPLVLPLTNFLLQLLSSRTQNPASEYIFPATTGQGYYQEPRRALQQITKETGIRFSTHDLRRTFATTAEQLNIPYYALKALLNHKGGGDVTAGYIQISPERLREPMEKVSAFLLEKMRVCEDRNPAGR